MPRLIIVIAFTFAALLQSQDARASALCDIYKEWFPSWYDGYCRGRNASSESPKNEMRSAGSSSSEGTSINSNPSGLPTEQTSYGLEGIGSFIRSNPVSLGSQFSLIKGFQKLGTFKTRETSQGKITDVGFGTSFEIARSKKGIPYALKLGLSARYNKLTGTVGGGGGLTCDLGLLTFGAGIAREKLSNYLERTWLLSADIGLHFFIFDLNYQVLKNSGAVELQPVHIWSLTAKIGRFMITGAERHLNYFSTGDVVQHHAALQIHVSKQVSIGLLYNYIPGATSGGLQYYF